MMPYSSDRIALFIYSLNSGGAERVCANLANYWAGLGRDVTVITLAERDLDFYQLDPTVRRVALGLAIDSGGRLLPALSHNFKRISALREVLNDTKPGIVLAMMSTASVLLALAMRSSDKFIAVGSEHIHPPQLPLNPVWNRLRAVSYGRLHAVTALTTESRHWLERNTRARQVPVIPNSVPWPMPNHDPRKDHREYLSPQRRVLLAVGRLEYQKGFDLLIEGFHQLAQEFPQWDLVILGEGRLRTELEAQVSNLGLSDRVKLPGRVGNISDWYLASDLYVMSSRFEGMGNTLVEAMAHGVPAVSFDCHAGPRDIIRHGVDGLLVEPNNVRELVTSLRKLMGSEKLRDRFASHAIEARDRFSMDRIGAMWDSLFSDLRLKYFV